MTRNEIKLNNIPEISVGNFVKKFSTALTKLINNGGKVKEFPSVMLWGPPGVGKSQAIKQIGDHIHNETGLIVNITDVRLLLFNPIDLRGIPTANHDKTLAVWLKPQIFQMDDSEDVLNILFLDEISSAPQSVQAAAYQITLDRVVGEHKLPDNCLVIAAGNRTTDKSVAYKMPKALANRLLHFEISDSFESWKQWAICNGVNEKVIGYLSFKTSDLMMFNTSSEDLAFATPRSWESVSKILNSINDDVDEMYAFIAGLVGTGVASEFRHWCKVYIDLPDIETIFNGESAKVPKTPDALYALISAMLAYARDHKDNLYVIGNSLEYAALLPPEYATVLLKDYMYIEEGYKLKLMRIPAFTSLANKYGFILNGKV